MTAEMEKTNILRPDPYFKRISRAFLARRGAPLILSAAEIDLIVAWERAGIPADAVLEGIERTFERSAARLRPRGRGPTLAYCRAEVERAFARWRDRRVGEAGRSAPKPDPCGRAAAETVRFLTDFGEAPVSLLRAADRAYNILTHPPVDEDALERLDAEADAALLASASDEDRRAAGPGRTRLLKRLRERYGLPYFAPFNY
ncbi:MAG: hypothetical protein NTZ26_04135 [Candidatus Aminicenantes bacterium]|nr:hypothetical protein [Candidatus Aminicenantes bacterium]